MFRLPRWTHSSRRLSLLLLTVIVPPAATLAWLGWQLLQQDRILVVQRDLERRQAAGQAIRHSLERSLGETERELTLGRQSDGLLRLTALPGGGVVVDPIDSVLWLPVPDQGAVSDNAMFAEAERLEFTHEEARAVQRYNELTRATTPAVRAGALVRSARIYRHRQQWDAALAAYRTVAAIPGVSIDGAPADLQARKAIGDVLQAAGRVRELPDVAASLEADLMAGRWTRRIDRAMWEIAQADIERWRGHAMTVSPDRLRNSVAVEAVWNDTRQPGRPARDRQAWRLVAVGDETVTVFADDTGERQVIVPPAVLSAWLERASQELGGVPARVALLTSSGGLLAGVSASADTTVSRLAASDTGLPWTVVVSIDDAGSAVAEVGGRRRLLGAGLAAILLLLGGSSYFFWHVLRRELAVARLQTEFVAAVSHEFRTPLTSLRHVTELLNESDDLQPDERRSFYGALDRSTERLQRLVESLLDFSRLESGRAPYDLQPIDAGQFASDLVTEFQREMAPRGVHVELSRDTDALPVRADRASLAHALWNLLDNAVKYSTAPAAVSVSARRDSSGVAIAVRDRGLGIPAEEQADIFNRFVRGRTATRLGIGGTGLGLAIVVHVVQAHGGTVHVESAEGAGSTFTITLPALGH